MKLKTKGVSKEDRKILIDTFPQLAKVIIDELNHLQLGNRWFPTVSFATFVVLKMLARQATPIVSVKELVELFCKNLMDIADQDTAVENGIDETESKSKSKAKTKKKEE